LKAERAADLPPSFGSLSLVIRTYLRRSILACPDLSHLVRLFSPRDFSFQSVYPLTDVFSFSETSSVIITPIFYLPTVLCSNPIPYQITIAPSTPCDLSSLPVSSLLISFTDGSDPIEVHHLAPPHPSTTEGQDDSSGTVVPAEVRLVSLDVEDGERLTADLRLGKGGKLVLAGSRKSEVVLDMRVRLRSRASSPLIQSIC
jgi:hypothetical protein